MSKSTFLPTREDSASIGKNWTASEELGGQRERVFQALIDRSRAPLDLDTIQTILGYRRRPRYRTRKRKSAAWEVGGRETYV
jgi:hypothetical protein